MKSRSFTLIEIMVCLLLIAMTGSVAVYKGWQMLREQRFSTSCERLSTEMKVTKVLALTYQIDIDLILEQKGKTVYLCRRTDFAPSSIKYLFQERLALSEVTFREDDGEKVIHFYGNGWIEGDEKVTFFLPQDKKKGYNLQIKQASRIFL